MGLGDIVNICPLVVPINSSLRLSQPVSPSPGAVRMARFHALCIPVAELCHSFILRGVVTTDFGPWFWESQAPAPSNRGGGRNAVGTQYNMYGRYALLRERRSSERALLYVHGILNISPLPAPPAMLGLMCTRNPGFCPLGCKCYSSHTRYALNVITARVILQGLVAKIHSYLNECILEVLRGRWM